MGKYDSNSPPFWDCIFEQLEIILDIAISAFFGDKKIVNFKQGCTGVKFSQTLLMAPADKGHVE